MERDIPVIFVDKKYKFENVKYLNDVMPYKMIFVENEDEIYKYILDIKGSAYFTIFNNVIKLKCKLTVFSLYEIIDDEENFNEMLYAFPYSNIDDNLSIDEEGTGSIYYLNNYNDYRIKAKYDSDVDSYHVRSYKDIIRIEFNKDNGRNYKYFIVIDDKITLKSRYNDNEEIRENTEENFNYFLSILDR